MAQEDHPLNKTLRTDSGEARTSDPLAVLFYLLMRDHLNFGAVESLVREVQDDIQGMKDRGVQPNFYLSNGWAAHYAENLANRIRALPNPR